MQQTSRPFAWSRELVREIRSRWKAETDGHRAVLVALMVIAAAVRLASLGRAVHIDERVTFTEFVSQPWHVALSSYPYPNNHLFHTLLEKVSIGVFGGALWAQRLPALIAGLLVVPATYIAVRRLYGSRPAMIATAIVATSAELVTFSVSARGYSLITLAFLLLLIVGARLQDRESAEGWILFAIIAALGLWTIPVMLFPLGTAAVWLAGSSAERRRWKEVRNLGLALGLAAVLTVLLYLPVIRHEGIHAITSNEFVAASTWKEFVTELAVNAVDTMRYWTLGMPGVVALALGACAIIGVRWHADVSRHSIDVPLAALAWCSLLLMLNPRAPATRMWQWLIPIAAGAAGAGLVWLLERAPRAANMDHRRGAVP